MGGRTHCRQERHGSSHRARGSGSRARVRATHYWAGGGAAPGQATRPLLIGAGRELNASPRNEPVPAHLDVQSWCNAGLLQRVFHWLGAKLCGAFNAGAVCRGSPPQAGWHGRGTPRDIPFGVLNSFLTGSVRQRAQLSCPERGGRSKRKKPSTITFTFTCRDPFDCRAGPIKASR